MPTTGRGYVYPSSAGHTRLWEHLQALAESVDFDLAAVLAKIPVRMAADSVNVTLTGQSQNFAPITFPVDRFTVAPLVVVSLISAPGGTQKFVPRCINITNAGANVYCYTGDATMATGTVAVAWIAIQMTESAAAG